ncbi:flagellar basal body P-ring formation chaperone FlgA [Agaribacterium haliotis]|uniref:flagellar basal body P-ring formation chaperone FlgA n=1 Tax=Agaribacterium haliotis TaxID=2013869 RepID=UPI000BB58365|nr:flagellar basal body P-ring formation chaperone FlgA [Agaribacterium haliotis]
MRLRFFLFLLLSTSALSINAGELDQLRQAVHDEVRLKLSERFSQDELNNDVLIRVSQLDQRLKLSECDQQPDIQLQITRYNQHKLSAKVYCPSGKRWSIYVPVNVDYYTEVAVANRPLKRGDRLSLDDVSYERRRSSSISKFYITTGTKLDQFELKRSIGEGQVLSERDLQPVKLVYRGEIVRLLARSGALTVSSEGEAMSDASLGQQIRVRNLSSQRVVDARIVAPGEAQVAAR